MHLVVLHVGDFISVLQEGHLLVIDVDGVRRFVAVLLLADIKAGRIEAEIGAGLVLIVEQGILLIGNAL